MRLTSVTRGAPRITLLAACGLLFFAALLDISQSAANPPAELRPAADAAQTTTSQPALVRRYQQTITPEALAARLYFLASDLLEGREATTRGQKLAAHYLASQYRLMGLAPKGSARAADPLSPDAYFQPFAVNRRTPAETRLTVLRDGQTVASSLFSAEAHDDLSYFLTGSTAAAKGGVVFAGYGISDDALGYDDYAALAAKGISIDGKWVMVLADEPLGADGASLFPAAGGKPTKWAASLMPKRRALVAAGKPAGVLVVRSQGAFADEAARASLAARRVGPLSLYQSPFPPTYAVSAKLADQILSAGGQQVEGLRRQINGALKPLVFEVGGVTVEATAGRQEALSTENVLAFIEGSDPRLKGEVVVISSHYDHLGLNPALKGDQIFNGAADDGSGVAATLELAQAFMRAKRDGQGPRRSVLFINFSAEEKGTLGSAHYALREPLVPLDKTVAEINMDGVGGVDAKHPAGSRNYIYIVGAGDLSRELIEMNRRVKELTNINLELTDGPSTFGSDHQNFQAQLVPFIYYSTGLTEHYHQPSDEAATIDYDHLARVTRLVFGTAWQVANQDARPQAVDRGRLVVEGYACPPCPYECDTTVHARPGECPVCGMTLAPRYK
jgi:hypothetical protein